MTSVIKRDGTTAPFDPIRIYNAIYKSFMCSHESSTPEDSTQEITNQVISKLRSDGSIHLEKIQDTIEQELMNKFHYTAKKYILYREERAKIRAKNSKEGATNLKQLTNQCANYFNHEVLRQLVYYRTYSRWCQEKGRREIWIETVERYINFMRENLGNKITEDEYNQIYQAILWQQVMPSMRLLQFAGVPSRRCNVCAYNCSFIAITQLKDFSEIMYILTSGTGVGFSVESNNINQLPVIVNSKEPPIINQLIVQDSKEGWADAFYFCLDKWYSGEDVMVDYSNIRPAGTRLKTMGGYASGPQPLKNLIEFSRNIILSHQGKQLRPIHVHDIICKIGEIVVAGGVRRSALISLFDSDDVEMRDCKSGQFWLSNPQRMMANNSIVYNDKPTQTQFLENWLALMKGQSGEPGIFSRCGFNQCFPKRRQQLLSSHDLKKIGTNPCVSGDTWILTIEGPRQVSKLIDKCMDLIVNGQIVKMYSHGFFWTGRKRLYQLRTRRGYNVKLTREHPVLIKRDQTIEWIHVKNVKIGDIILLSKHNINNNWEGLSSCHENINIDELSKYENYSSDFWKKCIQLIIDPKCSHQSVTDSYVTGNYNTESIMTLQRSLSRLGIISNAKIYRKVLCRLEIPKNSLKGQLQDDDYEDVIESITRGSIEDVYDVSVQGEEFCGNGIRLHNCSEILLQSKQFCNLCSVICRSDDDEQSLQQKVTIATILGTYQSTLTNFNYLSDTWTQHQLQERLLGVSLNGLFDCPIIANPSTLSKLKQTCISVNQKYAERFGINPSTAITCVKPEGSCSQLVNCASGLHPRFSPYYIRRIRISSRDPLFMMLRDQGVPYHPEVGQTLPNANTMVLEFPVKSPDTSIIAKNLTAIDQLQFWLMLKQHYTEHNPSFTCYVGEDEWLPVANWIYQHWDYVGGLSFLPRGDGHIYQLAPYSEITQQEYEKLIAQFPKNIDYSKLPYYENEDNTNVCKELACVSGACNID